MFRLRTFGGLSIERDGVVLDQLTAQRKALAVLAVVAAAPPSGVSRDKLLALFWPESDSVRARGALKQILHVLRKELGNKVIIGIAQLRLDPSQFESDVGDFRQALAAGDHDAAVLAYTGIFLDGVHLDDAAEFERWVDGEAAELARAHSDKVERLAQGAESRNDWSRAADLWRRLYKVDPLNTRVAIGLVNALDSAGDRAGALKVAAEHDRRLETELDLAPDAALAAVVARLRTTEPGAGAGAWAGAGDFGATAAASAAVPLERAPAATRLRRRHARSAVVVAGAAAVLFVLVLAAKNTFTDDVELDPRGVAVAVFENRSGDPRLDRLGSVAADWVTRGITRSLPLRVMDEATLYVEGRTAAGAPTDPRVLARRNGAGLVVSGSYYTTNDSVYFSARVVQAANGEVLRSLNPVGGPLTDPLPAVEELRQRVTAALANVTEASDPVVYIAQPPRYDAYQEYVAAEHMYWRGLFGEAMPLYTRAAALDSTFYLAEVRHSVAAVGVGRCDVADFIRRKLEPRLDQLGPDERIMLQINAARCESNWDEALRLSRARIALQPGSIQAAWPAAANARRGHRPAEALSILEPMNPARDRWALRRDKMFYWREVTAAQHVLGEHGAELRTVRDAERLDENRLGIVYLRARALIAAGRSADALRTIEDIELLDPDPVIVVSEIAWRMNPRHLATPAWVLHQLATELLAHGAGDQAPGLLERADQWFRRRPPEEAARVEHRLTHARVLELLGRYDEAQRLLHLIGAEDSLNLDHRGVLGVIAARRGNGPEAQRIDQALARLTTHPPGAPGLYRAQIAALLGDHTRALDLLEALPHRVHPADPLFFHSDPAFLKLHGHPRFEAFIRPRG